MVLSVALMATTALSQVPSEEYKARYERLVKTVGEGGLGVETVLNHWAAAHPNDKDMLYGRFQYYYVKSQSKDLMIVDAKTYLGQDPVLSLKDSLGHPVNYFQVPIFDDATFALSTAAIDKAISLYPDDLYLKCSRITALMVYEKDSPDITEMELSKLIDTFYDTSPAWTFQGQNVTKDDFEILIEEYCESLFKIGTPRSYEVFRSISEKMMKLCPKKSFYYSNMGSYYLVARKDNKQAVKWYNKALKIDPTDEAAKNNKAIAERLSRKR